MASADPSPSKSNTLEAVLPDDASWVLACHFTEQSFSNTEYLEPDAAANSASALV